VGKANGSRECAPDGVPTIQDNERAIMVGTAQSAPLPTLRAFLAAIAAVALGLFVTMMPETGPHAAALRTGKPAFPRIL
jgi:predicted secreted protein